MFVEKDFLSIPENAGRLIGSDWMLISAGTPQDFNTMTASWGGLGYLWNRPVAYIFIRPQRHTYSFVEQADYFSLCFFEDKYREILNYCGSVSGRDFDKAKETGLKVLNYNDQAVYYEQARLVLICRKLYHQDLKPDFFHDQSIHEVYPQKDYHRMYIGEIVQTLVAPESK